MTLKKWLLPGMLFAFAAALGSLAAAQAATNCTASQSAAVQCFVANAVATKLTAPRYGMSLAQFQAYGVAVSQILQTHHTYLVLVGLSSAVADAMPPANANGSANRGAQDIAVQQIVDDANAQSLITPTPAYTLQDCQWFALDAVNAMNDSNSYIALLTPGVSLRLIDSYVVTSTSNGSVNWTTVNSSLATGVNNMIKSGLMKMPAGVSSAQVIAFVQNIARVIYDYKIATGRKSL